MRKYFVLLLFLAFVLGDVLGFDLSIAPGLSAKNAMLYLLVSVIVLETAVAPNGGGALQRRLDYLNIHLAFVLLIALALLSSVATLLFRDYPGYTPLHALQSIKSYAIDYYLVVVAFLAGVSTASDARWLIRMMLGSLAVACAICLVEMFGIASFGIMTPRGDGRFQGPLGSNDYGTLMAFVLPLAAAVLYSAVGFWQKFRWFGVVVVFCLVLLFTASRGAVVALAGTAVFGMFILWKRISMQMVTRVVLTTSVLAVIAVIAVSAFSVQFGDLLYERFVETSTQGTSFEKSSGRTQIWAEGLTQMLTEPLSFFAGFGWRSFELRVGIASHNDYLEYFYGLGVVGLVTFGYICFALITGARKGLSRVSQADRAILMGFVFGFVAVLIASVFSNLQNNGLIILAFAAVVLRVASPNRAGSSSLTNRQLSGVSSEARNSAIGP